MSFYRDTDKFHGYECISDSSVDADGIRRYTYKVKGPYSDWTEVPLSPYCSDKCEVALWILAGCPERPKGSNWDKYALIDLISERIDDLQHEIRAANESW